MADAFNKLLQAEQLTDLTERIEELPRAERSVRQVVESTQELHSRVTQSASDIHAQILYGSMGIDLQQFSQKLETLSKRTFEPLLPLHLQHIADSDVEKFLKNERETALLSLIDEVNKSCLQTIEDKKWEHMVTEWNKEKIKFLNVFIDPSQSYQSYST